MSFTLLVAPPGAGKTGRLLDRAREVAEEKRRVWWVGLPSQRGYIYRRAAAKGALLGLEFLSSQQVYYRLLAHALQLKPLVVGTGRLALVGEALRAVRQDVPAPGEARLFARAIAEAKRYGVSYEAELVGDEEVERFRKVFRAYEAIKGDAWDYDDFRSEALKLVERTEMSLEVDAVLVDGFREIGPLELRLFEALGRHAEVWLALPEAPPGRMADKILPPRDAIRRRCYRAANPVVEARWVMGALKRDLATGSDPLELAVILPEAQIKAFAALADEYGVPLMDETPRALADTMPGRLLLDLLELPDYPSASKLLAIPELAPLARSVLAEGVVGFEAITVLAQRLGLESLWQKWLRLLEVQGDEMAWAEQLLETGLPQVRPDLLEREELRYAQFKQHAVQRAKEASRLAKDAHFRAWWGALLQETFLFDRPRGGVALLTANLASGRRFKKAYLMQAVEGAYTTREREDYFVPEEARKSLELAFGELGLPKRFQGRDQSLYAELKTSATDLTVTYSEAGQDGPLVPEPELVGAELPSPVPTLPAGSRLELIRSDLYRAERSAVELGSATLEGLRRYDDCAFRYWAERAIDSDEARPWWLELIDEMRGYDRLNLARLEELKDKYPQASHWLGEYAEQLTQLTFGAFLPETGSGPRALIDAAGRSAGEVTLYRFVAPERVADQSEAAAYLEKRWNELWAAGYLLTHFRGRITRVDVSVWPILQAPIPAFDDGITYLWRRIANRQRKVEQAFERFSGGDVSPQPGFRCRSCRMSDVCREGAR
ncbi:MAG: hypothetical protein JSV66_15780 [Trueperaceae bacterium]|nr:MAG: hypothetical protein JSV66_15780 [Trueperaceae bacterium]